MHDINLFSSPPLPPFLIHLISYNHTLTCQHLSLHTSISLQIIHLYIHYHLSWNLLFYVSTFIFGLIPSQPSPCEHLTNYALSFLFLISLHFLLIPLSASPLPSFSLQSPSIWASESGRAPDPPMRLGCEGAEPPRPGRGGASIA